MDTSKNAEVLLFFRDLLRTSRAAALADSEGFHVIIHAIELIGQNELQKTKPQGKDMRPPGLHKYGPALSKLASSSPLSHDIPNLYQHYHTEFSVLYEELRKARNDAIHQGAYARSLTSHATEISIILEDALMKDASCVSQFMVREVTIAKPWQPISFIRQQMLRQAFSYLPIFLEENWKLISELGVARYLRNSKNARVLHDRLIAEVQAAIVSGELQVLDATVLVDDEKVEEILDKIGEQPAIIVDSKHPDSLVGLLSASDIL